MKFVLAFNGSRGDIQPAIALATRLSYRGHDVAVGVPPNLVKFTRSSGVETHSYGLDTNELLASDLVRRDLKSSNPRKRLAAISEITTRGGRRMQSELLDLTRDADAIIGGSAGQERALNVADYRMIPYIPMHYCPVRTNNSVFFFQQLTRRFPHGAPTRLSWIALEQLLWRTGRGPEEALRADLGLPSIGAPAATAITARGVPEIQAYDPALFPDLAREWGASRPLVGFLTLSADTRARMGVDSNTPNLGAWLDAGTAPLYVGFGSMHVENSKELVRSITWAARRLGVRVLIAAGWTDLEPARDDDVRIVASVDHDAVLPRCVAAVHHGGAGSTAASLRAGIATFVCWIGADQPMWGARVEHCGAGISIRLKDMTAESWHAALTRLLSPRCAAAARGLSTVMISADAAVDRAADIAEEGARVHPVMD